MILTNCEGAVIVKLYYVHDTSQWRVSVKQYMLSL